MSASWYVPPDMGCWIKLGDAALTASWANGINAALMRLDTNQIYFFRDRRYVRYSKVSAGPDPGFPAWIDKNWMPFPRG